MSELEIYEYLKEKEVYAEVGSDKVNGQKVVVVSIEWGDWKHDHRYCDYLMSNIGFERLHEEVTEEDGSDCYSSDHFYAKK